MSDAQERLIEALESAQHDAARDYVKRLTSFTIGVPGGGDKLHIMLIDFETKEIIKKINCARFLLSNLSEDLLAIFRTQIEKEKADV